MGTERRENIFFVLFILVIIIMAVVYFSAPERELFLENQLSWWRQFID